MDQIPGQATHEGTQWFASLVSVVDVLFVAVVLYWVMLLLKGTKAERMLWGLSVVVVAYFFAGRLGLHTLHWMLSNFLASIVIIIIVVFQQDIKRALVQVGRPFTGREMRGLAERLGEIEKAVSAMSLSRTGGIIAMQRSVDLCDFLETGTDIDSEVSRDLILTIFNTASPLHDGAVIIRGGRIAKAGCILPLTEKKLTKNMGTRHRAAIGLSEETDAVVLVVSEKTGEVSIVSEEKVELGVEPTELMPRLKRLASPEGAVRNGFIPWRAPR